jgi:hypothetical protein
VPVRRRPAPGGDVHVDERVAAGGIVPADQDGVCVADEPDVRQCVISVRSGDRDRPRQIIRRGCRSSSVVDSSTSLAPAQARHRPGSRRAFFSHARGVLRGSADGSRGDPNPDCDCDCVSGTC